MKKTLLPLLLIVGVIAPVAAQYSLDIHGGANISRFRYSSKNNVLEDPQGFLPGYYLGLTPAKRGDANRLEFSVPLQYVVRVYSIAESTTSGLYSKERHHYAEINPRIGYAITEDVVVSLGTYWGYRLQTRIYANGAWLEVHESIRKHLVKNTDFGATGAFNWRLNRFSFHGNAQFGLGNITGTGFTDINGEPLVLRKHQLSFHFGMGYRLFGN
jgi:hypothetical protein